MALQYDQRCAWKLSSKEFGEKPISFAHRRSLGLASNLVSAQ